MPPSPEYLRALQELFKSGENNSPNLIHTKLQEVIDRESRRALFENTLVERYKRMHEVLHVHCSVLVDHLGRERRFKFCAVLHAAHREMVPSGTDQPGSVVSLRIDDVQVSVFVDVRQLFDDPQHVACIHSIVRLNRLDECERVIGNPWKRSGKIVVLQGESEGYRRIPGCRNIQEQGKFASPLPFSGQLDVAHVELDQIEREVIEGRFDLIDCFTRQEGDVGIGNVATQIDCGFAIRMRDNSSRSSVGVSPSARLDSLDMYFCSL